MKVEVKVFLLKLKSFLNSQEGWTVLVEGKRDKRALTLFGIDPVVEMKGKKYHDIAQELSEKFKGVVILTDLDSKGEEIFKKLSRILPAYGLKVNGSLRGELKRSGVKFIEKIPQAFTEERWK
ncbi:toprim domain-containing protein [Thermovibrio sp.]